MWGWRRSCWAAEAEKRKSEKAENAGLTNMHLCAIINLAFAGVAHLVERDLAKVEVASSSLVARSKKERHPHGCLFFLEQHFCYAKVNACGRVIEREWGNPSKVPPSHSPLPCGGRECRQQNLWTITKRNTTHPGGVSFACSAALLLLLPAETQAAIKKDTPSGRMGYLFAVQLRPSFSSDGGGSCRRCGYPPAR